MTQAGDDGVELAPAPAVGGDAERLRRQQRGVVRIAQQDDGQSASPGTDGVEQRAIRRIQVGVVEEEHGGIGGGGAVGGVSDLVRRRLDRDDHGLGMDAGASECVADVLSLLGHLGLDGRSEEHTSELQSQSNLVCRLLLEKKKNNNNAIADAVTHAGQPRTRAAHAFIYRHKQLFGTFALLYSSTRTAHIASASYIARRRML